MENWRTTKILLDFNKNEINQFLFKTFTIDSNGNTLDETEYDLELKVVYKRIYRYFDTGEIKEYLEYNPSDELLERHCYIKNESGEIYRHELEFSGGQKSIKEFFLTDIGNADKATIRDENGEITGFEVYILDEQGRIKEEMELDSDNNEIYRYENTYDDYGVLKLEKHYRDGVLFNSESFEYDEKGNVVKKIHKNYADKFKVIDNYEFDIKGNMVYNSSYQDGVLVFENKCGYDENNQLISEEFFEINCWEKRIVRHERLKHERI